MSRSSVIAATLLLGGLFVGSLIHGAIAGTAVPITRIDFAGAGGDFKHRTGTLVVPDRDTTASAYGGSLRRYDVHLAKMIEIAYDQWCKPRADYEGVYWNYEAANGNLFMGQFYVSCASARKVVATYGLGRPERRAIAQRGNRPEVVFIPVLDLTGDKIPKFMRYVQTLHPQCIGNLCPGNRTGK